MVFKDIEKLCEYIMQDNTISKKDCDSKSSQMYQIYNGLCNTEGRITGSIFSKIMQDKYKVSIIID